MRPPGGRRRHSARRTQGEAIDLAGLAEHAAERYARHINPVLIGVGGPTGLTRTFVRGEGAELFDESGRAYLDFVAGFGSLNLGHNHPEVVAAVASALSQQAPGFSPASVNPLAAALAEQLVAITPRGLEIGLLHQQRGRVDRSRLEAGAGGDRPQRVAVLPGLVSRQDVRGSLGHREPDLSAGHSARWFPTARRSLTAISRPSSWPWPRDQYAAFIVEPIQGEGGMVTPPPGLSGRGPPALPPGRHALHRRRGADRSGEDRAAVRRRARRDRARHLDPGQVAGWRPDAPGGHDHPPRRSG